MAWPPSLFIAVCRRIVRSRFMSSSSLTFQMPKTSRMFTLIYMFYCWTAFKNDASQKRPKKNERHKRTKSSPANKVGTEIRSTNILKCLPPIFIFNVSQLQALFVVVVYMKWIKVSTNGLNQSVEQERRLEYVIWRNKISSRRVLWNLCY